MIRSSFRFEAILSRSIGPLIAALILAGSVPSRAEDSVPVVRKKFRLTAAKEKKPSQAEKESTHSDHSEHGDDDHGHSLELSDEVVHYRDYLSGIANRPRTITERIEDKIYPENEERLRIIEERELDDVSTVVPERKTLFGKDRFVSPGPIDPGTLTKTGANWRPSFVAFGTLRSALQSYEAPGGERTTEWANRLDLFGNLYLSSTERFLFGFRPLDNDGDFTGVAYGRGAREEGFVNGFDPEPHRFYFEGYFDELFPNLDPSDSKGGDVGISLGRQPIFLQGGILANDDMDALGLTKHNMFLLGSSNARVSAFFGFNGLHRGDNIRDSRGRLIALDTQFDYPDMTIEANAAFVKGSDSRGGDGLYFGIGQIAQLGYWNSTFRLNTSHRLDEGSEAIDSGWLITHAFARTMKKSDDILTLSTFGEIDNYTSAARGPATGGPLGSVSLLQRAFGIGTYGPAIEVRNGELVGFEVSYQHFLDSKEMRQIIVSGGGAGSYDSSPGDSDFTGALALQYQHALSSNLIWSLGGFGSITDDGDKGFGVRTELLRKF